MNLSTLEAALMAIAIASWVQTLVLMGLALAAVLAWRKAQEAASTQLSRFDARLDAIAAHVGVGMRALDRTAESAARFGENTGQVVRTVAAATMPGTLLAATALRQVSRHREVEEAAMIGAAPGQMSDDRHVDSSYGFAAGLVIGMACGGILALLFAPKAGAELRGDINTRTRTMRDAAGRRYRDFADKASAGVEQMKEKAQGLKQKAQGMAADARDYAQSKTQQAANAAEQSTQH